MEERLASFLPRPKFDVVCGDCNSSVGEVIKRIRQHCKNPLVLCFVDPEGMNVASDTLKTLSDEFRSLDFIINWTAGAERVRGAVLAGKEKDRASLERTYGPEWTQFLLAEQSNFSTTDVYREAILPWLDRPISGVIPVYRGGNHLVYTLLFCTRDTESGSPGVNIWEHIASQLRGSDGEEMGELLDIKMGRAGTLDPFF